MNRRDEWFDLLHETISIERCWGINQLEMTRKSLHIIDTVNVSPPGCMLFIHIQGLNFIMQYTLDTYHKCDIINALLLCFASLRPSFMPLIYLDNVSKFACTSYKFLISFQPISNVWYNIRMGLSVYSENYEALTSWKIIGKGFNIYEIISDCLTNYYRKRKFC